METNSNSIKMFILPQQFPCGPQSSCCGPIGQSDEEIQNLKNEIEKELSCKVIERERSSVRMESVELRVQANGIKLLYGVRQY